MKRIAWKKLKLNDIVYINNQGDKFIGRIEETGNKKTHIQIRVIRIINEGETINKDDENTGVDLIENDRVWLLNEDEKFVELL